MHPYLAACDKLRFEALHYLQSTLGKNHLRYAIDGVDEEHEGFRRDLAALLGHLTVAAEHHDNPAYAHHARDAVLEARRLARAICAELPESERRAPPPPSGRGNPEPTR